MSPLFPSCQLDCPDNGHFPQNLPYLSVKPTSNAVAWDIPSSSSQTIKLNPQYAKPTSTEFNFDELITGSENKPVYNKVARKHVISAMEGYNAVVFAYGQTASGKTFTLVSLVLVALRKGVQHR